MTLTAADVAEIMRLVEQSGFDELNLEIDGMKLNLQARRGAGTCLSTQPRQLAAVAPAASDRNRSSMCRPAPIRMCTPVTSPLLGTFYRAPKPGAAPFVEVGSQVEEDTIVGIIEVMKLMNTVRAGVRGTVAEILAARRRARRIRRDAACACARQADHLPMRRILIANRGEIAVRIIRTCRTLGIETVLAASRPIATALPARLADRTVCIGPHARPSDSYLKVDAIVHAALRDAVRRDPSRLRLSRRSAPRSRSLCESAGRRVHRADGRADRGGRRQVARARRGRGGRCAGRAGRRRDLGR